MLSSCSGTERHPVTLEQCFFARSLVLGFGSQEMTETEDQRRHWVKSHIVRLQQDTDFTDFTHQAAKLRIDAIGFSAATSACEKGWLWSQCAQRIQRQSSTQIFSSAVELLNAPRQWNHALQMLQEMHRRRLLEAMWLWLMTSDEYSMMLILSQVVSCNAALSVHALEGKVF